VLVRGLWDASLADEIKDILFSDLIERLFPEGRQELWGHSFDGDFFAGNAETPGLFHQLLSVDRFPQAEIVLLAKFTKVVSEIVFDRSDSYTKRAHKLHILTEIFQHVSLRGEYLDSRNFERLRELARDDPVYQQGLRSLHFGQEHEVRAEQIRGDYPPVADIAAGHYDVDVLYTLLTEELACAQGHESAEASLGKILPLLKALFEREVRTAGVLGQFSDFQQLPIIKLLSPYLANSLEMGIAPNVFESMLLQVLFDLEDVEIANACLTFYATIFSRRHLDCVVRDKAFAALVRAGKYSSYVASCRTARCESNQHPDTFYNLLLDFEAVVGLTEDFPLSLILDGLDDQKESDLLKWLEEAKKKETRLSVSRQADRERAFYKAMRTGGLHRNTNNRITIGAVVDYEDEWYEYNEALIRTLSVVAQKDEAGLERLVRKNIKSQAGELVRKLRALFEKFYTVTPGNIRELVYEHVEKHFDGDVPEQDAFEEMEGIGFETSSWDDVEGQDDDYDADVDSEGNSSGDKAEQTDDLSVGKKLWLAVLNRWEVDLDEFCEELMLFFDRHALSRMAKLANEHVVRMLPGVSCKRDDSREWSERLFSTIRDEYGVQSSGQAKKALRILEDELPKEFRTRALRRDSVHLHQAEMPAVFKGRPPLVEFLAMRYYLELPPGEQKELVRQLDTLGAEESEGALIRRFFELTVVKVGQFLSIWPEVPQQHRSALEGLQDDVPRGDFQDVKDTIKAEFPLNEANALIKRIEPEPLNVGTIGEVYRVKIGDGKYRVLKVIPASKRAKVELTLRRLRHIYFVLDNYREKVSGASTAMRVISQLIQSIEKELDLRKERSDALAFGQQLRNYQGGKYSQHVSIPLYSKDYCSRSVLLMSHERAEKITRVTDGALAQKVAKYLDDMLNDMIANAEMYPDDLHPGNILVEKGEEGNPDSWGVVLLDFGRMGRTTPEQRSLVMRFALAAIMKHQESLQKVIEEMSGPSALSDQYDSSAFASEMSQLINDGTTEDPYELLSHLLTLAGKHHLEIGLPFIQILKAKMTMRGTLHAVGV